MFIFTLGAKIKNLIQNFKTRVLTDFGLFEAESCLDTQLTELNDQNLLDNASLVITPNAYKETLLYSVVPSDATGDMDVIRATRATRVNSDGLIEEVPYNLFIRSEEFGDWTKTASLTTINNTITAPNGTLTAETLRIGVSTSPTRYRVYQFFPLPINTYTASFYLKKANHRWIQLNFVSSIFGVSWANFDLEDGVIGNKGTTSIATITDVGNGWYRCTLQGTSTTSTSSTACEIVVINNTNGGAYPTYQSTVEEDVCYVWGAQLVFGTEPKEYLPVSTGFNIPRIDYSNGSCPSILVEPQRTNLISHSSNVGVSPWNALGTEVLLFPNEAIAPDGTMTAARYLTNEGLGRSRYLVDIQPNTTYTVSFWAKNISMTQGTSTVTVTGTINYNYIPLINTTTWTRISYTFTSTNTAVASANYRLIQSGNIGGEILLWGAQLEVGTNATSYIPTVASTVTRNADIIRNASATDLIGQTEGTVFIDYNKVLAPETSRNIISFTDGTANNQLEIWDGVGAGNFGMIRYTLRTDTIFKSTGLGQTSISPSGRYKICLTYLFTPSNMNVRFFINGVKIRDDNFSFTAFNNLLSVIGLGNRNNTFVGMGSHKIDYISKTSISDAQAIQLTTL